MKQHFFKNQKNTFLLLLSSIFVPVYMELFLHLFVYGSATERIVYPLIFAVGFGFIIFAISSLFSKQVSGIVFIILTTLTVFYFEVQFVYNSIFGEFMSVWQISFGADALTNFWRQLLYGIKMAILPILVLLLPVPASIILTAKRVFYCEKRNYLFPVSALALFFAFHFAAVGIMQLNDNGAFSVYRMYNDTDITTENSVNNIGILSTARLEIKNIFFTEDDVDDSEFSLIAGDAFVPESGKQYNMLNLNFDKLSKSTSDVAFKEIDKYLTSVAATEKNEYTGLLEGYNLVMICAESYSPYLVSEELTPTLYKLSNGGFVFNNYYGSFASNTTNGEYTFCMGLFPDMSRKKSTASFYISQENYVPYCMGNMFTNNGGIAYAYHDYVGEYYSRNETHANMGYVFKAVTDGLDMEVSWPASDLEMMQKSLPDYINSGKQFVAYYMSFSGHYQYDWENVMSAKNRAAVEDLPYSDTVKAYIACNLELEYALQYLMESLEKAGIADKTAIVLTNDHYPYGLNSEQYDELAGVHIETSFEKYRNSFICYIPGMREEVDTYCSTVDILPTLLNLYGFDFDSRLLAGRDVLSPNADNVAILFDGSFITEDFAFNVSNGVLTAFVGAADEYQGKATELQNMISDRFTLSSKILYSNYYAHAILWKNQSGTDFEGYKFTDMPVSVDMGAIDYVCENNYMTPFSDTYFGFKEICTVEEFADVMYNIAGAPGKTEQPDTNYQQAMKWINESGILHTEGGINAMRTDVSLTLYNIAKQSGFDMSIDTDLSEYLTAYPEVNEDEAAAMVWCFEKGIMKGDGSLESVFASYNEEFSRFRIIGSVYHYYLELLQ